MRACVYACKCVWCGALHQNKHLFYSVCSQLCNCLFSVRGGGSYKEDAPFCFWLRAGLRSAGGVAGQGSRLLGGLFALASSLLILLLRLVIRLLLVLPSAFFLFSGCPSCRVAIRLLKFLQKSARRIVSVRDNDKEPQQNANAHT